jgi:hypothetical protein
MPTLPIDYPHLPNQSISYQIVQNPILPPSFAHAGSVTELLIVAASVSMGEPKHATAAIAGIARVHPLGNAPLIFDASSVSGGKFIIPDMLAVLTPSTKPVPGGDVVGHEYVHNGDSALAADVFYANQEAILNHLKLLAAERDVQVEFVVNSRDRD